jgi:hypothetical protein
MVKLSVSSKYIQGRFQPAFPAKYKGDILSIFARSSWEYKFMGLCDSNPNIIAWTSEECVIPYYNPLTGKTHRYFVDFWVRYKTPDGKIKEMLVEIKPHAQTIQPKKTKGKHQNTFLNEVETYVKNKSKWDAAESYCKSRGMDFRTFTEYDLGIKQRPKV